MAIRNQVGRCFDIIDRLTTQAVKTVADSKKLGAAFEEIQNRFFDNPDNFKTFSPLVEKDLRDARFYEDMNDLVEVLKGRPEICSAVAIKIDAVISKLNTKGEAFCTKRVFSKGTNTILYEVTWCPADCFYWRGF